MDRNLQRQMVFNEKLQKLLREAQGSSLSIMIVSSAQIMNLRSNIHCFK
jgi:hypothetical protein